MNAPRLHDDPRIPAAAGPFFTHEYLTYHAVTRQDWIVDREPVNASIQHGNDTWPVGPGHVDRFVEPLLSSEMQGQRAFSTRWKDLFDCETKYMAWPATPDGSKPVEPWKVLVLYATEPDTRLDCDLDLHWSQSITQGSHGLRHMGFKLGGLPFGRLENTFTAHVDMAKKAKARGDGYWAWRYLARALHYLADMGHPMHVKVMPTRFLPAVMLRGKQALVNLTMVHNGHEVFVQQRLRDGSDAFLEAMASGATKATESTAGFWKEVRSFKKRAARKASPLFRAITSGFGEGLLGIYAGMDRDSTVDASKRTIDIEPRARDYIFANPDNPVLETLETLTAGLLEDVVFMSARFLDMARDWMDH